MPFDLSTSFVFFEISGKLSKFPSACGVVSATLKPIFASLLMGDLGSSGDKLNVLGNCDLLPKCAFVF